MARVPRTLHGAAESWTEPADVLLCLGAAHAWDGAADALVALRKLARPGGRLLFGDGCWEAEPAEAASEIFGASVLPLAEIVEQALAARWRVLYLDTADQRRVGRVRIELATRPRGLATSES